MNELEDLAIETMQYETWRGKKKRLKKVSRGWVRWENFKQPNIYVIGVPEVGGQEKNKQTNKLEEITAKVKKLIKQRLLLAKME